MTDCYVQSPLEDTGDKDNEEEEEKGEEELKQDQTAASLQKADDALGARKRELADLGLKEQQHRDQSLTYQESKKRMPIPESAKEGEKDEQGLDIMNNSLLDLNSFKFNNKLRNIVSSTCPIIPRYHSTYGQPIDQQPFSTELNYQNQPEWQKDEARKLLGRVDEV